MYSRSGIKRICMSSRDLITGSRKAFKSTGFRGRSHGMTD
ncbi:hypothetical protein RBEAN4_1279 [Rickettsia bellii str. RML An4]|uniref:Uncharacterized protein n=1 Tax=Rickettsia bellii str. RML An4 TaxID=1359193 RepID=A0A0F3QDP4_RICBE|nr:hypothetical protein RBEAN4_1279 [Rickettsia bellii str. RML An4]